MQQWVEVTARAFGMLVILLVISRVIGKKQLAQFTLFDYISVIVVGASVSITILNTNIPFMYGVIAVLLFLLVPFLLNFLAIKSKKIRDLVNGNSALLIKDGKILEDNLKQEQITSEKLLENLRSKNIFKVADVEFALMEPTGEINVLLKKENQPLTFRDLNKSVAPEKEPQTVIMDGEIMDEPLATIGLSRLWLKGELNKIGVAIENVYLGQVDSSGQLYVDLFDDKIQLPKPSEKPMLLATLKKSQADLESFALQTEAKEAKKMYKENARKMQKAIELVEKHLVN